MNEEPTIIRKVTKNAVENEIVNEIYFTAANAMPEALQVQDLVPKAMEMITFCVMILQNGHRIVGVNAGPIDPRIFDENIGRQMAREHALDQIWPLMGYALREKIKQEEQVLPSKKAELTAWPFPTKRT